MATMSGRTRTFFILAGLISVSASAAAFDDQSNGVYLDAGRAPRGSIGSTSATIGYVKPWAYGPSVSGGPLSFYWDFFLSQWSAHNDDGKGNLVGGHHTYTQIGAIGNYRYRFADGASPWFAEAGLGATVMDRLYHAPDRSFSTAFQFTEQVGFGRNFGSHGEHELSVRYQHFSNGSIKKPNPGENFVRVRYAYRF